MHALRKRRMWFIIFVLAGVGLAVGLSLFALRQNINLYYTPEQVLHDKVPDNQVIRIGGIVVAHSVHRVPNSLKLSFVLTDYHDSIEVKYDGLLPSLFRVGQGIVAQGKMNHQGIFIADQVLAKHDSTYRPPEIGKKPKQGAAA